MSGGWANGFPLMIPCTVPEAWGGLVELVTGRQVLSLSRARGIGSCHAALTPVKQEEALVTYRESRYAWWLGKRLYFDDSVRCV